MADIVERLRRMADLTTTGNDLLDIARAADEIERLRQIEKLARIYYQGYMQDEADSPDNCLSDQQHTDACALRDALEQGVSKR